MLILHDLIEWFNSSKQSSERYEKGTKRRKWNTKMTNPLRKLIKIKVPNK